MLYYSYTGKHPPLHSIHPLEPASRAGAAPHAFLSDYQHTNGVPCATPPLFCGHTLVVQNGTLQSEQKLKAATKLLEQYEWHAHAMRNHRNLEEE